jgi:hypothetical protein
MGLLSIFSKGDAEVQRLPTGSLTVDRFGKLVTTTVSSSYPPELLNAVACEVLLLFREARAAQLPFSEFNLQFASLQITARELRGGAIIYLSLKDQYTSPPVNHSPL